MVQRILTPRARPTPIGDLAEREPLLARQRRRRRATGRPPGALYRAALSAGLVLAVAALGALAWFGVQWLLTTPRLGVAAVEVLGLRRLPEAAIVDAAAIRPGTNLLAFDLMAVQSRLEALPQVRSARVIRRFPDRVTLLVREREPYALANVGGLYWLDAEGQVLGPAPHPRPPRLPILTGIVLPPPGSGEEVPDRVETGLALLRTLSRVGGRLVPRISEIDLGRPEGPVFYTAEGVEVRLGTEAWEERLGRLDALLQGLDERGEAVASIDLRFRDLVVMRPRGAAPDGRANARPGREERD